MEKFLRNKLCATAKNSGYDCIVCIEILDFSYFNFFLSVMNYQWKKQQFYTIGCATFGHAVSFNSTVYKCLTLRMR